LAYYSPNDEFDKGLHHPLEQVQRFLHLYRLNIHWQYQKIDTKHERFLYNRTTKIFIKPIIESFLTRI